ncbi:MAG: GNAT family N-acetyltransferase, partial [Deltaproteobacteria bacterium]
MAVRPLREHDLREADRIIRVAFGTFIGMPDPTTFAG